MQDDAGEIGGHEGEWPAPASGLWRVNTALSGLAGSVDSADMAPTDQANTAFEKFDKELQETLERWNTLRGERLTKLNQDLKAAGVGEINAEK